MDKITSLVFYFCFWAAVLGLFFIGLGLRIGDTGLVFYGLPFLFFGGAFAAIAYTIKIQISITFKG